MILYIMIGVLCNVVYAWYSSNPRDDFDARMTNVAVGFVVGMIWPVALVLGAVYWLTTLRFPTRK